MVRYMNNTDVFYVNSKKLDNKRLKYRKLNASAWSACCLNLVLVNFFYMIQTVGVVELVVWQRCCLMLSYLLDPL